MALVATIDSHVTSECKQECPDCLQGNEEAGHFDAVMAALDMLEARSGGGARARLSRIGRAQ